jgi:hypothetical protein
MTKSHRPAGKRGLQDIHRNPPTTIRSTGHTAAHALLPEYDRRLQEFGDLLRTGLREPT